MRWSLVFGLWVTTGVSQEQPVCSTNEALRRIGAVPFLNPLEPLEVRIGNAKVLLNQVGHECIPSLVEILTSRIAVPSARTQAARAVGVLGIAFEASPAVPALINLIESFEGQTLDAQQIPLVYYAHIAIGQIATKEAREFLYERAQNKYWKTRAGFTMSSPAKIPPHIFARGMAIQVIAHLGDEDAEDYLIQLIREPEFREANEPYLGLEMVEGDLRWKLTSAV